MWLRMKISILFTTATVAASIFPIRSVAAPAEAITSGNNTRKMVVEKSYPIVNPNLATTANGVLFPNPALTDHTGKKVRFYDDLIKGKIFLVNFIYTSCEAYCPMETARVKKFQDLLGERMGKDIFFYSISIDPETDTPEVLAAYRKKFNAGPGWTFLTGNEAEIDAMRRHLGLLVDTDIDDKKDHGLNMLIGNEKSGQWMRRSNLDKAEVIATLLGENLSEWRETGGLTNSFVNAPMKVAAMPRGEEIYKTRCIDCHSIGGGDGLGPDLKNVTKTRDLKWLTSWISAPNKMLAAKDPIAMAMLVQFKGLAMPNLGLSEFDVGLVIEFLKGSSGEANLIIEQGGAK